MNIKSTASLLLLSLAASVSAHAADTSSVTDAWNKSLLELSKRHCGNVKAEADLRSQFATAPYAVKDEKGNAGQAWIGRQPVRKSEEILTPTGAYRDATDKAGYYVSYIKGTCEVGWLMNPEQSEALQKGALPKSK